MFAHAICPLDSDIPLDFPIRQSIPFLASVHSIEVRIYVAYSSPQPGYTSTN